MAPFKRALFGYSRTEVDAAISGRDSRIGALEADLARGRDSLASLEGETGALSAMVIEREREMRVLKARLEESQECHQRSIASLDAVSARLEEMNAQARGQATRIRMKALREAMEVSRKIQAFGEHPEGVAAPAPNGNGSDGASGAVPVDFDGLYEGKVKLEIGPLGDFSQLVGFEDAIGDLGASEISVERFSEGRATLSMHLEEPIDLLQELEEHSALDFRVRHTAPDNLVLDLDHEVGDDPEQFAA
jgi:hypothetical protein